LWGGIGEMLSNVNFPDLLTDSFNKSKKSIQILSGAITKISSRLHPSNKNYEEYSLKISSNGLRSFPIPVYVDDTLKFVELTIDFYSSALKITSADHHWAMELSNRSLESILDEFQSACNKLSLPFDDDFNLDQDYREYFISKMDLKLIWSVLTSIYSKFLAFRSPILKEMSNINFWPHHFDLAMLLFSGNKVDGQDPNNWSYSTEQMNFGFLFDDEFIKKPYLYVTLYPFNSELLNVDLIQGAYWYSKEWKGAVLELQEQHLSYGNNEIVNFFSYIRNIAPEEFYK
jgi:hypothetical protein